MNRNEIINTAISNIVFLIRNDACCGLFGISHNRYIFVMVWCETRNKIRKKTQRTKNWQTRKARKKENKKKRKQKKKKHIEGIQEELAHCIVSINMCIVWIVLYCW